jgi:hypothetical protein
MQMLIETYQIPTPSYYLTLAGIRVLSKLLHFVPKSAPTCGGDNHDGLKCVTAGT